MFSHSTQYAIRAIEYLLVNSDKVNKSVVELATELHIPQPYLSKVMQQLAKNNIISSTKGRGGGFYLSDDNLKRPLIDIIVCMEGHNVFKQCLLGLPHCSDENPCLLHAHFKKFKKSIEMSICDESIKELLNSTKGFN